MKGRLGHRERAEAAVLHPSARARALAEIAFGGALGALARYLLGEAIPTDPTGFPWDTFTVNMLGCLAMGVLTSYLLGGRPHPWVRPLAITGYLGGFTTFSHLIDDLHSLDGEPGLAAGYAVASVVLGWVAVAAGLVLGRRIPRGRPAEEK
ncbi:CrcB family protein [Spirillospora sp. NPDC052242]